MKAVIQIYRTGELKLDETPPPQIRPGCVLVRNAFSLISAGTEKTKVDTAKKSLLGKAMARPDLLKKVIAKAKRDGLLKAWQAASTRLDQPTPLGYSCCGQVIAVGGDTDGLCAGDWVACGGGTANHAEIVCVPKNLAVRMPDGVKPDAAAFATLGAIAMQGVRQAELRLGEKVAVIGLGLVGLLTVQILKASGCRVLGVDVDPTRMKLAVETGCEQTVHAQDETLEERVLLFTGGYGVDATIITAGTSSNRPVEQAGEITREKGRVIVVGATGLTIPREPYYLKEIDLRISRSYGPGRYDPAYEEEGQDYPYGYVRFTERRNMQCFLELLQSGQVQLVKIISHRFPLEEAPRAYDLIAGRRKEPYLGILLEYPRKDEEIRGCVDFHAGSPIHGRIRLGVIGAGNYATGYLLPNLQRNDRISFNSVCTSSGATAAHIARKFGFAAACDTGDKVISSSDAVLVATRHNAHADFVVGAIKGRKPVFVEKPLAITEEQLAQVIDAVQQENCASIMVGFNRRFAPATVLARNHVFAVKSPKQILIRVNAGAIPRDHWVHDPKVGGGRLIGEGCHFVDLAVFLAGSAVKRVSAVAIPKPGLPCSLWDDFSLVMEMHDRSVATVIYTSIGEAAMAKERIEVSGGGRTAVIDDFRAVELWSGGGCKRKTWSSQDKGQAQEMNGWTASLNNGSPPIAFAEIVNVHRACFAAIQSIQTGVSVCV